MFLALPVFELFKCVEGNLSAVGDGELSFTMTFRSLKAAKNRLPIKVVMPKIGINLYFKYI